MEDIDDKATKHSDCFDDERTTLGRAPTWPVTAEHTQALSEGQQDREIKADYVAILNHYDAVGYKPVDCSWEDVVSELRNALRAQAESKKGDNIWLIKYRRLMAQNTKIIVAGLAGIPEELSGLHGGLAVVFNIAQSRESNRQAILEAFENIPDIIAMASRKCHNFPHDENLREAMEILKVTLRKEIANLVKHLGSGSFRHKFLSAFQGVSVKTSLDSVRRSAERVRECATDATYEEVTKINISTDNIEVHVERIDQGVHDLHDQYGEIDSRMAELSQRHNYMYDHFKFFADNQVTKDDMYDMLKDVIFKYLPLLQVQSGAGASPGPSRPGTPSPQSELDFGFGPSSTSPSIFTDENPLMPSIAQPRSPRPRSPSYPKDPDAPRSPLQRRVSNHEQLTCLLDKLQLPHKREQYDFHAIMNQSEKFKEVARQKTARINNMAQYHRWLSGETSALLLVQGHLDPAALEKTTPISQFCATMIRIFQSLSSTRVISMPFFCGQHTAFNDPLYGPQGLIGSLLEQLIHTILRNWPCYSTGINVDIVGIIGNDQPPSFDVMLQLFPALLRYMPTYTTVFCIIDDITRLEKQAFAIQYSELMAMFNYIIYSDEFTGPRFKLLMTSPTRSTWLNGKVPPEHLIELADNGRTHGRTLTRSEQTVVVQSAIHQFHGVNSQVPNDCLGINTGDLFDMTD